MKKPTVRGTAGWLGQQAIERWWLDPLIIALLVLITAWRVAPGTGIDFLGRLDLAGRRVSYNGLSTILTFFAGFVTLSFTQYLGWTSRGIKLLRKRAGGRLMGLWLAGITYSWLSVLAVWFVNTLDRGGVASGNDARWVILGTLPLAVIQLARLVWVFYQLVMINTAEIEPARKVAERGIGLRRAVS